MGRSRVFPQFPTHCFEICLGPFHRFTVRHSSNGIITTVVPTGQTDDCEHLDDLAVRVMSTQVCKMPRLDHIGYKRSISRQPQCGLFRFGEFRRLFKRPDIANPIRVDAHQLQRVCAMRLAVLTPGGDARHRKKLAAKLLGKIGGRNHCQLDKILENPHQFRPAEDLKILPIPGLSVCHVGFSAY